MSYLGDVDDLTAGELPREIDGNCPICGGTLALTGDDMETWVVCEQCNLEGAHNGAPGCTAIEVFEGREFENLADCPYCDKNHGIKLGQELGKFYVKCECGLHGPFGKDEIEALERYNAIFL